jgi:hypothetical protein
VGDNNCQHSGAEGRAVVEASCQLDGESGSRDRVRLCHSDMKRTLGSFFSLGSAMISWQSKKQSSISLSIAEAE